MRLSYRASILKLIKEKNDLAEKEFKKAFPLVAVSFDGGIVIVSESKIPFAKIRSLGKNIFFAAIGEATAINKVFGHLLGSVNNIETGLSEDDVFLESIIDNPNGVATQLYDLFHSTSNAPMIIKFILGFVEKGSPNHGVAINYRGEREYWEKSVFLSKKENVTDVLAEMKVVEPVKDSAEAIKLAISFLEKNLEKTSDDRKPSVKRYEIGILSSDGKFKHFFKEVAQI